MTVLADKIMKRIRGHGRGNWVCGAKDFLDLGSRAAVDQALSRLHRRATLRRVRRGLYDWPRPSRALNRLAPTNVPAAVAAIARRDGVRIMPNGIVAAHHLGLTNAVPAKAEYWTDGPTRTVQLGPRTVRFKHMHPNLMHWADRPAAAVVSALAWLGPNIAADPATVDQLRRQLPDPVKQDLIAGTAQLPTWAIPIAQRIQTPVGMAA
jgi:hypothetical protein